ncbi:MAG: hypothetical protein ACJAVR_002226 [Paracoccaceae bacterium]|jgi:hypothetical protein
MAPAGFLASNGPNGKLRILDDLMFPLPKHGAATEHEL